MPSWSRQKGARRKAETKPPVRHKTFAAPVGGLVTATSLIATAPASARVLDNFFPQQETIRTRGGSRVHASLPSAVVSFMSYIGATRRRMFAATKTAIYDVSFIRDGDLTEADATLTGINAGYFSHVNFSTEGGEFLTAVNGTDPLKLYDGTQWYSVNGASTPYAITFSGSSTMTTSKITHVSVYRNRQFFVRGGSMEIWYLSVNSLAGTANRLNLAGVFKKGGAILFTATWSIDAGDGLDDKFVVVTVNGEAAVYQGSNPGDANDWQLVGRYDISPALGINATMQAGGDLLVATEEGLIPISSAVSKDTAALALSAVSKAIEPDWKAAVRSNRARPWEIAKWTRMGMAVVTVPSVTGDDAQRITFVVNLQTGAWARYTGWDARCLCVHDGWLYFGTADGEVMQAEVGRDDAGTAYYCTAVLGWDHLGEMGALKMVSQARATFLSATAINPQITVSTDYVISLPSNPTAPVVTPAPGLWDIGRWDEAVWDDPNTTATYTSLWASLGVTGYAIAPQIQMAGNGLRSDMVEVTMTWTNAGVVC